MKIRNRFTSIVALLSCLILPTQIFAWGADGHRVVGAISLDHLEKGALQTLHEIMGTDSSEALVQWCNWPDAYRATEEGRWSEPKHYINMVPGESLYVGERDCPTGMCVTEAIGEYAAELQKPDLDIKSRRQAFGWVCHLVGDLHQPLHAGFGHDRGGNDFPVHYKDEDTNIHSFWDSRLILDRSDSWQSLYDLLSDRSGANPGTEWKAAEAVSWTNESHAFAETWSYPENPKITPEFADQSWELAQKQLKKGGYRLAWILNTVLAPATDPSQP
jgi:hypothetical protein